MYVYTEPKGQRRQVVSKLALMGCWLRVCSIHSSLSERKAVAADFFALKTLIKGHILSPQGQDVMTLGTKILRFWPEAEHSQF